MSESVKFIKYWLPSLVWMVLIFSASADTQSYRHSSTLFVPLMHWLMPSLTSAQLEAFHHFFRKCGHFTEYGILAVLIRRTVIYATVCRPAPWTWATTGIVIGLVFLYASSDEFHQIFVPSRTPLFSDVLIDTAGGATGLLVIWLWRLARKNQLSKQS